VRFTHGEMGELLLGKIDSSLLRFSLTTNGRDGYWLSSLSLFRGKLLDLRLIL